MPLRFTLAVATMFLCGTTIAQDTRMAFPGGGGQASTSVQGVPPGDGRRVALVIGQDAYKDGLKPLNNPTRDARLLGELLSRHGFDVSSCHGAKLGCYDLDRIGMDKALNDFEAKAEGASLALIFFAGHGMASAEGNILTPTDARVSCEQANVTNGIPVERFMNATAKARGKILILDACRDNPFAAACPALKDKPLSFTRIESAKALSDLMIVTSTEFGQPALDGRPNSNSPFLTALLGALQNNETVYLDQVMNLVVLETEANAKTSNGFRQVPQRVYGGNPPRDCLKGKDCVTDKKLQELKNELNSSRQNALVEDSKLRATQARAATKEGRATDGILIGLEGLPDPDHPDSDRRSRRWNPEAEASLHAAMHSRREMSVLSGHLGGINTAVFAQDGKRVLTASGDRTARLWDVATGRILTELSGHDGPVWSATFSPDEQLVLTASSDHTARLWDTSTGQVRHILKGHSEAIISAAFSANGELVATASDDNSARIWKVENGALHFELNGHKKWVRKVSFSPDSQSLVTASVDGTARVWDARSGKLILTLVHPKEVKDVAVSRDGSMIVTASADGVARSWDRATGRLIAIFQGHSPELKSTAFSPDGLQIVTTSSDKTARLWDVKSGALLHSLKGHFAAVFHAAFSPDGQLIATASLDQAVSVWNATSGLLQFRLLGHSGSIKSVHFSPDGRYLTTASTDGSARIWDVAQTRELAVFRGHTAEIRSASFSPDGRNVVTASADGSARVFDVASANSIARFTHGGSVDSAVFDRSGTRVVTASTDWTARVWNVDTSTSNRPARSNSNAMYYAGFNSDGSRFTTIDQLGQVRIWDTESGARIAEPPRPETGAIQKASTSHDGRLIVVTTLERVLIWEAETGRLISNLEGPEAWRESAHLSNDASKLVVGLIDGYARIWDISKKERVGTLSGHTGTVYNARFSPDDRRVVTASADGTARVWDIASGLELVRLEAQSGEVLDASFSKDGKLIVTAHKDGTARLWSAPVTTDDVVSHARSQVPRCAELWLRSSLQMEIAPPQWCVNSHKWPYDRAGSLISYEERLESGHADVAQFVKGIRVKEFPDETVAFERSELAFYIRRGRHQLEKAPRSAEAVNAAKHDFETVRIRAKPRGELQELYVEALIGLGLAADSESKFADAIDHYEAARLLGSIDAGVKLFWSKVKLASERRQRDGTAASLLAAADAFFELEPRFRQRIPVRELQNDLTVRSMIGRLSGDLAIKEANGTSGACARAAANPTDPLRKVPAVEFDGIDEKSALAGLKECATAAKAQPNDPSHEYHRGRLLIRLGDISRSARDMGAYRAAADSFEIAMAKGYPHAFNNMSSVYEDGEGREKDLKKAAELSLQALNRTLHCCFAAVAEHVMGDDSNDHSKQRIVGGLLAWAVALGSSEAKMVQARLVAAGKLPPSPAIPTATFADLPPWLRGAKTD